nr:O-antigen ligase family protein [Oscillospiraceae bacterium]
GSGYLFLDIYSQGKAFAVVVIAIIMMALALLCCVYLFRRIEKRSLVFVGLSVVYVAMTLISALCSEYREIALWGQFDRAEGFFTTACYFVIFLFTMYSFKTTSNFRYVVFALFFCVGVNTILGIFQFTGNSLENNDWFLNLIIDKQYADSVAVDPNRTSRALLGALYNYNYVGSFTGLVIPLFSTMAIFDKKVLNKIFYIIFDMMALFMLMGSTVRSGVVAVTAAIIVGVFLFFRLILKRWKIALASLGAAVLLVVGGNLITEGAFFRRVSTLLGDMVQVVAPAEEKTDLFDTLPVREIIHNKDGSVTLVTQGDEMNISFSESEYRYVFTDKGGGEISVSDNSGLISTADERYSRISFDVYGSSESLSDGSVMYMRFDNNTRSVLTFVLFGGKNIHLVDNKIADRIEPINAEHIGFEGKELVGSSRGYIWSRTIPLLKNCILIGYGADTFAYVFPQQDFLAKYYSYAEGFHITVDKPHNLYLQIFISNGLVALIAFLGICLFYLVDCVRLYALKKEYRTEQIYGAAVMLAIVGYLTAGMFNDSVVSVAPMFWILLGVGCALNTINRRLDKNIPEQGAEAAAKPAPKHGAPETISDDKARDIAMRLRENDAAKKAAAEAAKKAEREANPITRADIEALTARINSYADKNGNNVDNTEGKDT